MLELSHVDVTPLIRNHIWFNQIDVKSLLIKISQINQRCSTKVSPKLLNLDFF